MEGQHLHPTPESCPFTIEEYHINDGLPSPRNKTFLIREHDHYGEYPHIYAKICQQTGTATQVDGYRENPVHKVIVLSDTGCGTEVPCWNFTRRNRGTSSYQAGPRYPQVWNIFTFLEYTLNPGSEIPYLVMTTHCHYDHILGIGKLPPTAAVATVGNQPDPIPTYNGSYRGRKQAPPLPPTTVLTSSQGKGFVTPYSNLQKHSLAGTLGLYAPKYDVGIWAKDYSQVVYHSSYPLSEPKSPHATTIQIPTPYTILHTPGHTPDSLSWYDADNRVLCVGDSFYLKETPSSRGAPWGPEPPMPTMFDKESDLADWWRSLHKVLDFVVKKNRELGRELGSRDGDRTQEDNGSVGDGGDASAASSHDVTTTSRPWLPSFFSSNRKRAAATASQTGSEHPPSWHSASASHPPQLSFRTLKSKHLPNSDPWLLVDVDDSNNDIDDGHYDSSPRVHLAAAHTTSHTDAHTAILEIKAFVAAILRDEIPKWKVENGPRGEERWLWDVDDEGGTVEPTRGRRWRFSVLAPTAVVEDGRRRIPRAEWD